VVLHCNGELAEMEEVAAAAGRLRSRALTRARSAVRAIRKPLSFDRRIALRDLDALLGV
jgi:beta-N-acetylhexosaminidase